MCQNTLRSIQFNFHDVVSWIERSSGYAFRELETATFVFSKRSNLQPIFPILPSLTSPHLSKIILNLRLRHLLEDGASSIPTDAWIKLDDILATARLSRGVIEIRVVREKYVGLDKAQRNKERVRSLLKKCSAQDRVVFTEIY
ncbi:hypothetical protein L218DRAFT_1007160 [Marasmius fiardii PR-910]|nr:hypothetical protein L218DRAFT_1007160 [Marasmius fiardii PR-910]